jgi:hypothetical protein
VDERSLAAVRDLTSDGLVFIADVTGEVCATA